MGWPGAGKTDATFGRRVVTGLVLVGTFLGLSLAEGLAAMPRGATHPLASPTPGPTSAPASARAFSGPAPPTHEDGVVALDRSPACGWGRWSGDPACSSGDRSGDGIDGAQAEAGAASPPTAPADSPSLAAVFVSDGPLELSGEVTISGGTAPFAFWINDSAGDRWNGSFASDGSYLWSGTTRAEGFLTIVLVVIDGSGFVGVAAGTVVVPAAPPPDSAASSPVWEAAGVPLALGGGTALAVVVHHRKARRPTPVRGPDPVTALRAILEPSDGADRTLVELEAEEAGVPPAVARSTLDRLITSGAVRAERSPEGEEVLAWERRGAA